MRYLLLLALTFCVHTWGGCQEKADFLYSGTRIELNKKLLNAYSIGDIQEMENSNPDLLLYLNYFADHAYELMDRESFHKPLANISTIALNPKFDPKFSFPDGFEIFKYDLILRQEAQYFELNTKQIVRILPQKVVVDKFNAYRNSLNN